MTTQALHHGTRWPRLGSSCPIRTNCDGQSYSRDRANPTPRIWIGNGGVFPDLAPKTPRSI
ncbi:hypothetical protein CABS01_06534 [Colletotrichum abscissum]|uniref:Uncharacterized protein n=1 Tax=Colletotrichum cuscutae TaxID=1209917 RepID=A0AAI9UNU0_9PEZI|nr:uncharacterized protein CABS01_06534 [Colletotrichum abscissum]KAK1461765.1 hypothetical protein CCUS01_01355 [Colletotrichum cuscutae]KAK1516567.1 hypothetical protein CABS01_06534 [Colletotrichum abscissum]